VKGLARVREVTGPVTVTAVTAGGIKGSATLVVDTAHTVAYDTFTGPAGQLLGEHRLDIDRVGRGWTVSGHWGNWEPFHDLPKVQLVLQPGGRAGATRQDRYLAELHATVDTHTADGVVAADWIAAPGNKTFSGYPMGGVIFRWKSPTDFWVACHGCSSFPLALWKIVNDKAERVQSLTPGDVAGQTHGPEISLYWDGLRMMRTNDSFLSNMTQHGLMFNLPYDWVSQFDNFSVLAPSAP